MGRSSAANSGFDMATEMQTDQQCHQLCTMHGLVSATVQESWQHVGWDCLGAPTLASTWGEQARVQRAGPPVEAATSKHTNGAQPYNPHVACGLHIYISLPPEYSAWHA